MAMNSNYLVVYLLILVSISESNSENSGLLSVVQVFRHGFRTPIIFYPTDPYQDKKYWNGLGPGELTDSGKIQLHNLGSYFRKMYHDFLPQTYNESSILIKSDKNKRNILSAIAFMQGLYPNLDRNISIDISDWSVLGTLVSCLKFDFHYIVTETTDKYFREVNKENREMYRYIRRHTLMPTYELLTAFTVWDTLYVESLVNLKLPEWTQKVFPEALAEVSKNMALSICYTEKEQIIGAGPFLNELIQHFDCIVQNCSSKREIVLYSGHDVNIACFLNTFGVFETLSPEMPPFASSLIFEMRKIEDSHIINGYYKPHDEMIPIKFRGCGYDCALEDFRYIFRNVVINKRKWLWKCFAI
ncbi:prostatic acid phosphatase [Leptinotarsa decemlineata]|uniref:prostatic acid phosphatase n=1 Tax=Leptinotarsa decemlineata TaxID=7539 RepID=UPI003D30D6B8